MQWKKDKKYRNARYLHWKHWESMTEKGKEGLTLLRQNKRS